MNELDYNFEDAVIRMIRGGYRFEEEEVSTKSGSVKETEDFVQKTERILRKSEIIQSKYESQIPKKKNLFLKFGNNPSLFLETYSGRILSLTKNKNGSKYLQEILPFFSANQINQIFYEILKEIPILMLSKYGNYFCRCFFSYLNLDEKVKYLNILKDSFYKLATSKVATYPLQSIIEEVRSEDEIKVLISLVNENIDSLIEMSVDDYAAHVVEKILFYTNDINCPDIFTLCIKNFSFLATNKNGIIVLKRIITSSKRVKTKNQIMNIVNEKICSFVNHIYANHAIQFILENWIPMYHEILLRCLIGKLTKFSLLKYSSIVLEKFLITAREKTINLFYSELCDLYNLSQLINSKYGSFVLIKIMMISLPADKLLLVNNISRCFNNIKDRATLYNWLNICKGVKLSLQNRLCINSLIQGHQYP